MICSCGKEIKITGTPEMIYKCKVIDKWGNIIYAICLHGTVVIDLLSKENNENSEHL